MDIDIEKAIQEFEDEAFHHSMHPEISNEAKAVALRALKQFSKDHEVYVKELESEVAKYRNAARLYGIDADTMLTLAKSQIVTCADNIRMMEAMDGLLKVFDHVPKILLEGDLVAAMVRYDGNKNQPYCDLVFDGLSVLRKYLKVREEYDEWRRDYL